MKSWILFDFDGTIANTLNLADRVYHELADHYKLKQFTKDEIHELKHLSFQERLKMHHISVFKLPRMIRRTRKIVSGMILESRPYDGMVSFIKSLKEEGFGIAIVSSNSKRNIKTFLDHYGFQNFDHILGGASLFGKDRLIKRLMRRYRNAPMIYIGDELRDIISTKEVSMPMIAVTWGYDDTETLMKAEPEYLCHDIISLQETIRSHFKKG